MVSLAGTRLRLRPFRPPEVELVWRAHEAIRGERGVPTPRGARRRLQRLVQQSGSFDGDVLYLAVDRNGQLIGEIDARRGSTGLPSGVAELGIDLWDERSRGKGFGTEAVTLLVRHLFEEEESERIEARAALDNAAMCRLLEKLGFVREGVLRNYMPRGKERSDYALYALLRTEWLGGSQSGSTSR